MEQDDFFERTDDEFRLCVVGGFLKERKALS